VASLPEEQVAKALHVIFDVAKLLRLDVFHTSRAVSCNDISSLVAGWMAEILEETGDVSGSDSVKVLIWMEYDKRRT
jgi:hypothetical protein